MGNHRFRLSNMMPNAWFYKLKDMSKTRNHSSSQPIKKKPTSTSEKSHFSQPRYSYYIAENSPKASETHYFPDPPRRSIKRRTNRKAIYKPSPRFVSSSSVSSACSCHANPNPNPNPSPVYFVSPNESSTDSDIFESLLSDSESDHNFAAPDSFELPSLCSSCNCRVSSSTTDIIIDMNNESFTRKVHKLDAFDTISSLDLPRILTKPAKFDDKIIEATKFKRRSSKLEKIGTQESLSFEIVDEKIRTQKVHKANPIIRKSSANSAGIRLRANSPRLASKKVQAYSRKSVLSKNKSLSGSFAVVKSSLDPQRDFMDSMVEMIVENDIRASKDLEDLLACYLSLNSNEYHDLIVKAFEEIWFDMADLRL